MVAQAIPTPASVKDQLKGFALDPTMRASQLRTSEQRVWLARRRIRLGCEGPYGISDPTQMPAVFEGLLRDLLVA